MSLAANALISVKEYKTFKGIDSDNDKIDDAQVELWIDQASQFFEAECNRKFITPASATDEIFDGDGTKTYYVKYARITESPTVSVWNATSKSFDNVATTYSMTFTYVGDTGRVYFTDGNVFSRGEDNYQVSYKYGWTLATIPADLKLGCMALVHHFQMVSQKQGLSSEAFGDNNASFDLKDLPHVVKSIIRTYTQFHYA